LPNSSRARISSCGKAARELSAMVGLEEDNQADRREQAASSMQEAWAR